MARKDKKSTKNEKKINSSVINVKKGGKVVKKQPEINSKKNTVNNQVKCPKCSKLISNNNRNKSIVCATCLKKEAITSEKTAKRTVAKSKPTSTSNLKQSTQVREPSRRSKSLNSKNDPKPNLKSPKTKSPQKSSKTIGKVQANATGKRKGPAVAENAENKKHAKTPKTPISLKPSKLDKKESFVATTKKTDGTMSLRGRKRSYAQLASGIKADDENKVKKRKNSAVSKGVVIRNSRDKKPTVKGSEWLNTIHSKKSTSPKQDKNKKTILPIQTKSPKSKTISPIKGRKGQSPKIISTTTKMNTSSKRNVSQNSRTKSLARKSSLKSKDPPKPTQLKTKSPKVTSIKQTNLPKQSRNNTAAKPPNRTKRERISIKENDKTLKSNKNSNEETYVCLTDDNVGKKENVIIVEEILHGILDSVHCSIDPDPILEKISVLDTVVSEDITNSTIINDSKIHTDNANTLENNDINETTDHVLSISGSCSGNDEPSRNLTVQSVKENSICDLVTDPDVEHIKQPEKQGSDEMYTCDKNSVMSETDNITTTTNISQDSNAISTKNLSKKEVSPDDKIEFSQEKEQKNYDGSKNTVEVLVNDTQYNTDTTCKVSSNNTANVNVQNKNTNEIKKQINVADHPLDKPVSCETSCSDETTDLHISELKDISENNIKNPTEDIEIDRTNCVGVLNQESASNLAKQSSVLEDSINPPQGTCKQVEKTIQEENLINKSVHESAPQQNIKEGGGISVSEEEKTCMEDHKSVKEHKFDNSSLGDSSQDNNKEPEDEINLKEDLIKTSAEDCKLSSNGKHTEEISKADTTSSEKQVEENSNSLLATTVSDNKNNIKDDKNNFEAHADQNKLLELRKKDENDEKNETKLLGEIVTDMITSEVKYPNQENNAVVDSTTNETNLSIDAQICLKKNALETSGENHTEKCNGNQNNVSSNLADFGNKDSNLEAPHGKCSNIENGFLSLENEFPTTTVVVDEYEKQGENSVRNQITCKGKEISDIDEEILKCSEDDIQDEKSNKLNSISEKQNIEKASLENINPLLDTSPPEGSKVEMHSTEQTAVESSSLKCDQNLSSNIEKHETANKEYKSVDDCEVDAKDDLCGEHKNDLLIKENTLTLHMSSDNKDHQNLPNLGVDKSSIICSQKVTSSDANKNTFEQSILSEVTEHTLSENTGHTHRSVVLDKLDGNQLSETSHDSLTSIKEQIPIVKSTTEEVVGTQEEMEINLPTSSILENVESKMLQPELTVQEIKTSREEKEVQPDSSTHEKVEFDATIIEKGQSHEDKVILGEIEDVCLSNSSVNTNIESESQLKLHLKKVEGSEEDKDVDEDEELTKHKMKPESIPAEINMTEKEEVRESVSCDVLTENDSTHVLSNEDTITSLDDKTAEIVNHSVVEHQDINSSTSEEPKLDQSHQSECSTRNEHVSEVASSPNLSYCKAEEKLCSTEAYSETTVSGTQKDEEMLVDDQTTIDYNHKDGYCKTNFVTEESQSIVSSTNEDLNSASENHIEVDTGNCKTDQISSKMEDFTNDSISVDDMEGESMQCNSETRSSNRMSVDEDNAIMDLDTDDTAVDDICPPTFETKLRNELNMEVS